jgi:hypothetical protein
MINKKKHCRHSYYSHLGTVVILLLYYKHPESPFILDGGGWPLYVIGACCS